jgi:hypothetical protein
MARATDFLSQTSGKQDEMFQTRQTDHGTILARNPKRRGITRRSAGDCDPRQAALQVRSHKAFREKLPDGEPENDFCQRKRKF